MTDTSLETPTPAALAGLSAVAAVRTSVEMPLRFADGYATPARLTTLTGLVDGKEHLALDLGDCQGSLPDLLPLAN